MQIDCYPVPANPAFAAGRLAKRIIIVTQVLTRLERRFKVVQSFFAVAVINVGLLNYRRRFFHTGKLILTKLKKESAMFM